MDTNFCNISEYLTIVNSSQLNTTTLELILTPLEEHEYRKLSLQKQKHRLLGRLAAKQSVQEYYARRATNLEYQQIEILNNNNGAPTCVVSDPNIPQDELLISISHTNNYAIAAVANKNTSSGIGVDIEKIKNLEGKMIQRFLSTTELEIYHQTPNNKQSELGILYWSAKEAYFKASKLTRFNPKEIDTTIEKIDNGYKLEIISPDRSLIATGYSYVTPEKFIITTLKI